MEATQNLPGSAAITGHNREQQREPGAGGGGRPPLSPGSARAPGFGAGVLLYGVVCLVSRDSASSPNRCLPLLAAIPQIGMNFYFSVFIPSFGL